LGDPAAFAHLTRDPSLAERVGLALMDSITSGRLQPGDRLPSERDLGEQFGVSRTVVREAVRGLQARGVLKVRPGRGAEVVAVPVSHITETFTLFLRGANTHHGLNGEHISEVRETLEIKLVELACARATPEDLDLMARAIDAMAGETDVERASASDMQFHRLIASATKNTLFVILLDSLGDVLLALRRRSLAVDGRRDQAVAEHRRILAAMAERDVPAARAAMAEHLAVSRPFYGNGVPT
jgi:GntR family transcriptional regulator, transcriptional repressor for pyruvate dehydrogenase complex